jgi:hypothetical protein
MTYNHKFGKEKDSVLLLTDHNFKIFANHYVIPYKEQFIFSAH